MRLHLAVMASVALLVACGDETEVPPMPVPEARTVEPETPPVYTPDPGVEGATAPAPMPEPPSAEPSVPSADAPPDIDVANVALGEDPPTVGDLYTVQQGDTLYSIARRHNVVYADLVRWNRIDDPDRIEPSQQIRVTPDQ
jgi:LysM repeat protein